MSVRRLKARERGARLRDILGFSLQESQGFDHESKEAGFSPVSREFVAR